MRSSRFALLVALCCAAPIQAQQASYTTYGQACGGVAGEPPTMPQIWATGLPQLGSTFTVHYQAPRFNCRFSVGAFLLTGLSRNQIGSTPLPWRIPPGGSFLGGPVCFLQCSAEVIQGGGLAGQNWTGQQVFSVPNDPQLLGLVLYQQWYLNYLVVCPSIIYGVTFLTEGGQMTIGR